MVRLHTAILSSSSSRYADWMKVFGSSVVAIKSPGPQRAGLPRLGVSEVYLLDLAALTTDQRRRLVDHLADRFGVPAEEVEAAIDKEGVPILAEDVSVSVDMRYLI